MAENCDLSVIINDLHSVGCPEDNISAWKKALCLLVTRVTDNHDNVSTSSEREVCIEFVNYCVNTAPLMFAAGPNISGLDSANNDDGVLDMRTTLLFSHWLMNRLIYMLTTLSHEDGLNKKVKDILINLMDCISMKNCQQYAALANEFISTLAKLSIVFEDIVNSEDVAFTKELNTFGKDISKTLKPSADGFKHKNIIIESQGVCEKLQLIFTDIISQQVVRLTLTVPQKINGMSDQLATLWASLSCQLEYGNVELKTLSMKLSSLLLLNGNSPAGQVLDYFLECVECLIDLLISGFDNFEGDFVEMEHALSDLIKKIVEHMRIFDNINSSKEIVHKVLVKAILTSVIHHGSQKMKTSSLQDCLFQTLLDVCSGTDKILSEGQFEEERKQMNQILIDELMAGKSCDWVVNWLKASSFLDIAVQYEGKLPEYVTLDCSADIDVGKEKGIKRKLTLSNADNRDMDHSRGHLISSTCEMLNKQILQAIDLGKTGDHTVNVCYSVKSSLEVLCWVKVKISSKEPDICLNILDASMISALLDMWKKIIVNLVSCKDNSVLLSCFEMIVEGIGSLLFCKDLLKMTPDMYHLMTWILSVHWLPAEMSWMDLKVTERKELMKVCNHFAEILSPGLISKCIMVMAYIPKEVASKWRTYVLKVAASDTDDFVRSAVVKSFPIFLYHMGPNANHLVHDTLQSLVKDKSLVVLVPLAKQLGQLTCIIARKAVISRDLKLNDYKQLYNSSVVKCTNCDHDTEFDIETNTLKERPKTVDPSMFIPFIELGKPTKETNVRHAFVISLERLFGHLNVRSGIDNSASTLVHQCMYFLSDADFDTRIVFSKALCCLVSEGSGETLSPAEGIIIEEMKKVVKSARMKKNYQLMETILRTTGNLAKHAEDSFLVLMIIVLLDNICKPICPLVGAVATNQLKLVSREKKIGLTHLFIQFGKKFCKVVADNMYEAEDSQGDCDPLDIIKDVVDAFEFESTYQFFKQTEPYLLPHLVKKGTATGTRLIKMVAKQLGDPNHKGPVYRNIGHIYCHIVCNTETDEFTRLCRYLEEIFDKPLVEFLSAGKNMEFDLLLRLASHRDQVLRGFRFYLCRLDEDIAEEVSTDEGIARVLQPKLLGMFVHLDNFLNNGTIEIHEKKKAYESLITLIELMGPSRITAVRVRMMTTLKIGLKFTKKGFPELCCKAWNCFVRSIDINSVGSMISQIIVSLLPLLNQMPNQVADVLHYLIVENRKELHGYFHELFFIPDIPELKDVNAVLKHYTEKSNRKIKEQIENFLKGISHESKDVRQHALTKLQTLLHNNKALLHSYILGSENVHPIISKTIYSLLDGCRDSTPALRALYGACLGELGAVDPGRIQKLSKGVREDNNSFNESVANTDFCYDLVCKLSQEYLRALERSVQDMIAYAVQSMIQTFQITDDESLSGYRIWSRFSEEVKEIITPLLTSRYMMTAVYKWDSLNKPIYGGKKGLTFDQWVCTLTTYLGSLISDPKPFEIFNACRGVLRTNSQIALFMLPYAIVHVLLEDVQDNIKDIETEILAVLNHAKDPDTKQSSTSELSHLSTQTVFSVLDHLQKWLRQRVVKLSMSSSKGRSKASPDDVKYMTDPPYLRIKGFLERIPLDTLAQASFNCGAYTRSLKYYEQFIKTQKDDDNMEEHWDFMQKLYASIGEADGVTGVTSRKLAQSSLSEKILAYESTGQLYDALVCYDNAVKLDPNNLQLRQGLLKCRLALGELNSAMEQANGMIAKKPEWTDHLNEFRVESAWKLGQWDDLKSFITVESETKNWNVSLGKIILAAREHSEAEFNAQIQLCRNELMTPLSAASMEDGSYQRGYDYIVQLHMLNEVEQCLRTVFDLHAGSKEEVSPQPVQLKDLLKYWEQRLQLTQSSFKVQEPILNLRRTVLSLARESKGMVELDQEIGLSWLQTARIARECGLTQAAHGYLLSASGFNLPEYCIENAKWLWARGAHEDAQVCLEKAVVEYYPDTTKFVAGEGTMDERFACAQVLLLLAQYREETASLESAAMFRQFRDVTKVYENWEDSYFTWAKYIDKLMVNVISSKPEKRGEFTVQLVSNLGQSLQYGSQNIYQSMPRMLSLWLDFGAEVAEAEKSRQNEILRQTKQVVLNTLNSKMDKFIETLPAYQFLTAFPQLISRICHAHPNVFSKLKDLIAKLLIEFPQQAMWGMMAVSKSTYLMRSKRCEEIFSQAKSMNSDLHKFLLDSLKLTERLLELCNKQVDHSVSTISIRQQFKPLQRLIDDRNFSQIILPLQALMTVTLPSTTTLSESHNPFPNENVFIRGLEDTVDLFHSLQRPKKVIFIGSDGKNYPMLCKPKDDLRKDARLMDFNSIVNKCLHKDPEARRRNLNIRTFAVTPLNEECGMLEWVPNTASLRQILFDLYKEKGSYTTGKELRSMQLPPNAPLEKKLDIFRNQLMARHKAVFSEWFVRQFPDPTSWYNARLAYCRTTAVMSMVGYILGLGDRHGENILFDSTTGECVHVDFNCLFNKGESFDYPEVVPFRLTHNMIEAMGPLGYEGIFKRACEVCLRVLRDQKDPLMSVLKAFIYDPLVEWIKPSKGRSNLTESGEICNEKAQTHVNNIESRLKGIPCNTKSKLKGLPLSVEGQVNHLIKEATEENNLCQMYIGWAAYL